MNQMICSECSCEINKKASSCSNCGNPVTVAARMSHIIKTCFSFKGMIYSALALLLCIIIAASVAYFNRDDGSIDQAEQSSNGHNSFQIKNAVVNITEILDHSDKVVTLHKKEFSKTDKKGVRLALFGLMNASDFENFMVQIYRYKKDGTKFIQEGYSSIPSFLQCPKNTTGFYSFQIDDSIGVERVEFVIMPVAGGDRETLSEGRFELTAFQYRENQAQNNAQASSDSDGVTVSGKSVKKLNSNEMFGYSKWSFKFEISNHDPTSELFDATVKFIDDDGFEVGSETVYGIKVPFGGSKIVTGTDTISHEGELAIKSIEVELKGKAL